MHFRFLHAHSISCILEKYRKTKKSIYARTENMLFIPCIRISFSCILENTKAKKIKYAKQQKHVFPLHWFSILHFPNENT